jgi:predicted enzyme related to lactoylglutathione lyase
MSPTIRSLVVPVSDLDAAKAVYTALLGAPHTDESYYVGYNIDGFEVGLAPGEVAGGPVAYADVEDLDATRATLLEAGATERDAPRKVAPEARVCVLADADGNPIGLRGRQPSVWPGRRRTRRAPALERSPSQDVQRVSNPRIRHI